MLLLIRDIHMCHAHRLAFPLSPSLPYPLCRSRFLVRAQLLTRV